MNNPRVALVTGSSSGLGFLIAEQLSCQGYDVVNFDRSHGCDVRAPRPQQLPSRIDVLVNCAGVNRIGWLPDVQSWDWDEVMDVNAKGIFLMTQACLPQLKESRGTVVNIVSNAAWTPMRCSAAYNASKGAALTLTKQLARELIKDGITVFAVSPNKLRDTGMSLDIDEQVMATRGWTREQAQAYQLQGLLIGEETDPERCAEFIAWLLSSKERHKYLAGCNLPYGL
jgi:NAD(P)-dependent dehydrogenase (short-subunit alcohol dehydrogenase family)